MPPGTPNLIEHQVSTDFAENLFGVLSLKRVGALSQDLVLNVNNVRASVAVLGGLLTASSAIRERTKRSIWVPWSLK